MSSQFPRMEKAVTSRTRNYVKNYQTSVSLSDSGSEKSLTNYCTKRNHSNDSSFNSVKAASRKIKYVDKQSMTVVINNNYYNEDNLFRDYAEINNNSDSEKCDFTPNRNNVSTPVEIETKIKSKLPLSQEKFSERVVELLKLEPNGVWASTIISAYEKKYNEHVGKKWVSLMEENKNILMEKDANNTISLCYKGILSKSKKMKIEPLKLASVPKKPTIHIINAVSTIEIWAKVLSVKNDLFQEQLNHFYKQLYPIVEQIEVGGFYIVDFRKRMNRVKVLNVDKEKIECFFVDSGEVAWVQSYNFYNIMFNHCQVEAEAFVCSLEGLEELCNSSFASFFLKEMLEHKDTTIKITQNDKIPKVTIYTIENGKKINLNEKLSEQIYHDFTHPILKKGDTHEVFVTHVNGNGSILVQWQNAAYVRYMQYMDQLLSVDFSQHANYAQDKTIPDEVYITLWPQDGQYYRCKILSTDQNTATVLFVDYGNTDTLVLKDSAFYLARKVLAPLAWFPFQVTEVLMDGLENKNIERLKQILDDDPVWIKIVGKKNRCEFFKAKDGIVFSINEALKLEEDFPKLSYSTDDVLEIDSKVEELSKKIDQIWGKPVDNSKGNKNKFSPKK